MPRPAAELSTPLLHPWRLAADQAALPPLAPATGLSPCQREWGVWGTLPRVSRTAGRMRERASTPSRSSRDLGSQRPFVQGDLIQPPTVLRGPSPADLALDEADSTACIAPHDVLPTRLPAATTMPAPPPPTACNASGYQHGGRPLHRYREPREQAAVLVADQYLEDAAGKATSTPRALEAFSVQEDGQLHASSPPPPRPHPLSPMDSTSQLLPPPPPASSPGTSVFARGRTPGSRMVATSRGGSRLGMHSDDGSVAAGRPRSRFGQCGWRPHADGRAATACEGHTFAALSLSPRRAVGSRFPPTLLPFAKQHENTKGTGKFVHAVLNPRLGDKLGVRALVSAGGERMLRGATLISAPESPAWPMAWPMIPEEMQRRR